jgi:Tol biopolymer transport system component/DNA-binding winged helix-turn-helix (wHTH) protein
MHEKENVPTVIRFGPFTLDGRSGELRNGPTRLKVPDQSIAVLQALLERPGELVTREALRDRLWGSETFVDYEAGLNAAVRRLREALHDSADTPRYVETLPRRGYRFIAPVDGTSAAAPPAAAGSVGVEAPASARSETARAGRVRSGHVVLATLALAVIGAAFWGGARRNDAAPAAARSVPITSFPGLELDPAISPAGNFVAFAWEGEGGDNFDIYVRSIDGKSLLQLTKDAAADHAPTWSPDGQQIAFVRVLGGNADPRVGEREIIVLPALGGPEQRLFEAGPECGGWRHGVWACGLSWTPDGKHLVFGALSAADRTSAVYLYSLKDGKKRQLTRPTANLSDIHPVVSPDGRYLAFVRLNHGARGGNVFLQKLEQLQVVGEPTQLTFDRAVNAFDWTQDSRSVIHDAGPVEPGLWRIAVAGGATELVLPNIRAFRPSVARSGAGVVYQNMLIDSNIWELPTPSSPNREPSGDATFRVIASTSGDSDMQFSPDGTRIVFCSHRSGHSELWVSNRDGSRVTQLTHFEGGGRVGSPSWSADGKRIAFDAILTGTGSWNLHIVAADGGPVEPLTSDAFNNTRPSWSLDKHWIYFASDRTGDWQIWKMPSSGGKPEQITWGGGRDPVVSWDGRRVYYAKSPPIQGIWAVPAEGGQEVQIVGRGRSLNFDVAENGIFMMDPSAKPQATVEMFSFASLKIVQVARLPAGLRLGYFAVSRDGRSMLYTRADSWTSDIEMLPGVR